MIHRERDSIAQVLLFKEAKLHLILLTHRQTFQMNIQEYMFKHTAKIYLHLRSRSVL